MNLHRLDRADPAALVEPTIAGFGGWQALSPSPITRSILK